MLAAGSKGAGTGDRRVDTRPVVRMMGVRMQDRLIFLIGAPRSGTTLLARMLSAHSQIYGRAEPHLITPLAHLGYFGKVAEGALRSRTTSSRRSARSSPRFPTRRGGLPRRAARVHRLDVRADDAGGAARQALLPRQDARLRAGAALPDEALSARSKYVVLTRHPLAVLSSYVESFFDGDYRVALEPQSRPPALRAGAGAAGARAAGAARVGASTRSW